MKMTSHALISKDDIENRIYFLRGVRDPEITDCDFKTFDIAICDINKPGKQQYSVSDPPHFPE